MKMMMMMIVTMMLLMDGDDVGSLKMYIGYIREL